MARPIHAFPDGSAGVALALLRISAAVIAEPAIRGTGALIGDWWPAAAISSLLILALAAGLFTRAAAVMLIGALAANLALEPHRLAWLSASLGAAALIPLGPGAFSMDSLRFGRRVIRVGPPPPDG